MAYASFSTSFLLPLLKRALKNLDIALDKYKAKSAEDLRFGYVDNILVSQRQLGGIDVPGWNPSDASGTESMRWCHQGTVPSIGDLGYSMPSPPHRRTP